MYFRSRRDFCRPYNDFLCCGAQVRGGAGMHPRHCAEIPKLRRRRPVCARQLGRRLRRCRVCVERVNGRSAVVKGCCVGVFHAKKNGLGQMGAVTGRAQSKGAAEDGPRHRPRSAERLPYGPLRMERHTMGPLPRTLLSSVGRTSSLLCGLMCAAAPHRLGRTSKALCLSCSGGPLLRIRYGC